MGIMGAIGFILVLIFCFEWLRQKELLSPKTTRKYIHIGVAHTWLIAMFYLPELSYAIVPPILFTGVNYWAYRKNIWKSMNLEEEGREWGTIYYPFAMSILMLLCWSDRSSQWQGAIAIFILGYGDGLAALVGQKYKILPFQIGSNNKTLLGSAVMLLSSFLVCYLFFPLAYPGEPGRLEVSLIIALSATIMEAVTPFGLDNLTIPFFVFGILNFDVGSYSYYFLPLGFHFSLGFSLSILIAFTAYRGKSLSKSGAYGATFLGTAMMITSGLYGCLQMFAFFLSSSFFSHFKKKRKEQVNQKFEKGSQRDVVQVFANGGVGLIFSFAFYISGSFDYLVCLAISFAVANADTWATELGVLNSRPPISLRTFQPVDKGTSGAVSFLGIIFSFCGAAFIGLTAVLGLWGTGIIETSSDLILIDLSLVFLWITALGALGSFIDSILGAYGQALYRCSKEGIETEKAFTQGEPNELIRGFRWLNNDLVNLISIISPIVLIHLL